MIIYLEIFDFLIFFLSIGWSTGKVGSYLPNKKSFVHEEWRFREFVVPNLADTPFKPYVSPKVDPDMEEPPLYFEHLFSDELVSEELRNNPRLLEECRASAERVKQFITNDPRKHQSEA